SDLTIVRGCLRTPPAKRTKWRFSDCQKTSLKVSETEQRGVCAGGKKPTARSIKQDFETFLKVSKSAQRGEKAFSTRCLFMPFLSPESPGRGASWPFSALQNL